MKTASSASFYLARSHYPTLGLFLARAENRRQKTHEAATYCPSPFLMDGFCLQKQSILALHRAFLIAIT
jgi:hypothetical protein